MDRNSSPIRARLYRSRRGLFLGVCRGLADYFGVGVLWWRLLAIITFILTTGWPVVIIYIVAAFVLKPEPVVPLRSDAEAEFYESYVQSRALALRRLRRTFEDLRRRVERIETIVTSRDYDWEQRLGNPSP